MKRCDISKPQHFPATRCAFTLLELLVAMVVFSLLLVALFGIVDNSTQLWRSNENRVDSYREARGALHTITQELRSLYPASNPDYFSMQFPGPAPENVEGFPLFFLTTLSTSAQDADATVEIAALGYYLAYQKPSASAENASFNLHRFFRNGDQTLSQLTTPGASLFADCNPQEDEILARNITHFQVTPLYTTSTGISHTRPTPAPPYPQLLEIRLRAINSDVARRFAHQSDWSSHDQERTLEQNSREFAVRVHLPQPPMSP